MLCISFASFSQIKHDVWFGHFKVRSNSLTLPYGLGCLWNNGVIHSHQGYRWLRIMPEFDIHVPIWKLLDNNEKTSTKGPYWWRCLLFGDYSHNYNFSLGYTLSWRSFDIPVGARLGVNYEWRGLCVTEGRLMGEHRTSGVIPSVNLTWNVLGLDFEREEQWNIIAEIGTSYVKILTYNDPIQLGRTAVNDGWRGLVSLGVCANKAMMLFAIRYEWDNYNYFNVTDTRTRLNNLVLSFTSYF